MRTAAKLTELRLNYVILIMGGRLMEANVEKVDVKKVYVSPELTEYGSLEKLTLGITGGSTDVSGTTPMVCL